MPKTITMRVEDDIYVSDNEMNEILNDKSLMKSIKQAEKEIDDGEFEIVK